MKDERHIVSGSEPVSEKSAVKPQWHAPRLETLLLEETRNSGAHVPDTSVLMS